MKKYHSSIYSPLNKGLYSVKDRWHFSQFGYQIDSHVESYFPDLNNVDIAFFNIPEYEGTDNVCRSQIVRLGIRYIDCILNPCLRLLI